jgi:hypothetical protein
MVVCRRKYFIDLDWFGNGDQEWLQKTRITRTKINGWQSASRFYLPYPGRRFPRSNTLLNEVLKQSYFSYNNIRA